jgi:hypothetical protein
LNFSEVIAFEVLESHGYFSPVVLRSVDFCRWYEVRREKNVFEVEVYDSAMSESPALKEYLNSLSNLPDIYFRKPVEVMCDRGITLIVRPLLNGVPLYSLLLKPEKLPIIEACKLIRSFEAIHSYLLAKPHENFSPLALLFFYSSESKQVILDGQICGPWVNYFKDRQVLYDYLKPDLCWASQINYFRNSIIQKLLLGQARQIGDDLPKGFDASKAVCELLTEVIRDPDNCTLELSSLEKKYGKKSLPLTPLIVVFFAVILLIAAFRVRQFQSTDKWQGELIKTKSLINNETIIAAPLVNYEFSKGLKKSSRLISRGDFLFANTELTLLAKQNQNKHEILFYDKVRERYIKQKKIDFEQALALMKKHMIGRNYGFSSEIMKNVQQRYGRGSEFDQASSWIKELNILQKAQTQKENIKLQRQRELIQRDRSLILKVERIKKTISVAPVQQLLTLNKSISKARSKAHSKEALYLLDCYRLMNMAEIELFGHLFKIKDHKGLYRSLSLIVPKLKGVEVYEVSKKGIEYRHSAGGGMVEFQKMSPKILYRIFQQCLLGDDQGLSCERYLFCIKYELLTYAENELKRINSVELLRKADSLKGIKNTRKKLFTTE